MPIFDRGALEIDFERVGGKLSAQTREKGAPDYNPLSRHFMAVAEDGKLVGQAILTHNWGKGELELMFVEPEERGKGVGTALMSAVEDFARVNGLACIRLNTPSWQGEGFYERVGYEELCRVPMNAEIDGKKQFEITYAKTL